MTDLDQAILDLEQRWFRYAGAKEATIRAEFGMSATRYYQKLNALLDVPEALAYAPQVVHRLRRLRDKRAASRRSA